MIRNDMKADLPEDKAEKTFDTGVWLYPAAAVILVVIRQFFAAGLPLFVKGSTCDDHLMVEMARGLLDGNWLGPYNGLTLMKGCFFPLFLAAVSALHLKYLSVLTALHSAACFFFVREVRPLVRSRLFDGILLALLLFDPSSMAERSFQAIYRTTLTGSQVILIFACFFGLYLKMGRRPVRDLIKGFFAGCLLWGFLNTREDAVWILPFVITASAVIIGRAVLMAKRDAGKKRRAYLAGIAAVLLPLLIVCGGNAFIKAQNLKYYGAAVRIESSDGAFADALKTMFAVKDNEIVPLVSVTREKLERFYQVSPTLTSIRDELDAQNSFYDQNADRHKGDGQIEDGWFQWSLKKASFEAGEADSLIKSEAFYDRVRREILAAVDDPSSGLEVRSGLPSALMSYPQEGYVNGTLRAFGKAVRAVASFESCEASVTSRDTGQYGEHCKELTRENVFYEEEAGHPEDLPEKERKDLDRAVRTAERVNRLSRLYGTVMPVLMPLAGIVFIAVLLYSLISRRKSAVSFLLVTASLALSACVDLAVIAYTDISAFAAIRCDYLAGVYPLAIAFAGLVLFKVAVCVRRGIPESGKEM